MDKTDKQFQELNRLMNKADIKRVNGLDDSKELQEVATIAAKIVKEDLESNEKVFDAGYVIEACDAIVLLCNETLKGADFFQIIHNLAFQVDMMIEIIDTDIQKKCVDFDWLENLTDTDLIKNIRDLFVTVKDCVINDRDNLPRYRLLIFDYLSEYYMRVLKNAQDKS